MSWIVVRRNSVKTQIYVDTARIDVSGRWASWDERRPWEFPLEHQSERSAMFRMGHEMDADPDWEYEVREYLK